MAKLKEVPVDDVKPLRRRKKFNSGMKKKDGAKSVPGNVKKRRGKISKVPANFNAKKLFPKGLLYVGHLPFGFYESALYKFFSQFGSVTGAYVARSRNTGEPLGYGYVSFTYPEVAKIAAESMNKYFFFNRILVAKYIPSTRIGQNIGKRLFIDSNMSTRITSQQYPKLNNRNKNIENHNKMKDEVEEIKSIRARITSVRKAEAQLKKLGVEYTLEIKGLKEFEDMASEVMENTKKSNQVLSDSEDEVVFNTNKIPAAAVLLNKTHEIQKARKMKSILKKQPCISSTSGGWTLTKLQSDEKTSQNSSTSPAPDEHVKSRKRRKRNSLKSTELDGELGCGLKKSNDQDSSSPTSPEHKKKGITRKRSSGKSTELDENPEDHLNERTDLEILQDSSSPMLDNHTKRSKGRRAISRRSTGIDKIPADGLKQHFVADVKESPEKKGKIIADTVEDKNGMPDERFKKMKRKSLGGNAVKKRVTRKKSI